MAFKIILILALLGSAFAAPAFYGPPQRDANIVVGSSVSGPRTFVDPAQPVAKLTDLQNDASLASNSGAAAHSFPQSSGTGFGTSGSQNFPVPREFQGSSFDSRPISGPLGVNPSGGSSAPSSSQSFEGFKPFGSLGSASSSSGNFFPGSGVNVIGSQNPVYEEHVLPRSGPAPSTQTVTNQVTKTHTLRVPVTSDVWVTAVTMVTIPVTQLSTQRRYVPGVAGTVTSVVRITRTPVSIVTRTVEVFPAKTMVSVFTTFATEVRSVEFWQPIVHLATNYEVMTVPVLQTQTLLQRVFTTVTITRSIDITSTRQFRPAPSREFVPRAGAATFQPSLVHGF